ncbi:MAG: acyl-CoA/acyl-ACP dehydrogenase [Sulfolobaceae archaeon]|nr:acyl-CoA/acyl-ACP dehydrogenase [Sulfolobaceae archaeon]
MSEESEIIVQNLIELSKELEKNAQKEEEGVFPRENLKLLAEHEYFPVFIPKPYGMGLPARTFVDVVKTIAKASPSTAWIYVTHVAAANAFNAFANNTLKEKHMKDIAEGKLLIGAAGTEAVGGAINAELRTTAELQNGKYVIKGSKSFITGVGELDLYLIIAKVPNAPKPHVFLVDKSQVKIGQKFTPMGMKGISWGELIVDATVDKDNLVIDDSLKFLGVLGRIGMLGVSAISYGIAEGAFEEALNHVKNRKLGNNTLASFEGVQIYLAEIAAKVEAMKQLLYHAADNSDKMPEVLKARIFITENAIDVIDKALRITGAHGYSNSLKLEKYYRDVRAPMLHFQTLELSKKVLASTLIQ